MGPLYVYVIALDFFCIYPNFEKRIRVPLDNGFNRMPGPSSRAITTKGAVPSCRAWEESSGVSRTSRIVISEPINSGVHRPFQ